MADEIGHITLYMTVGEEEKSFDVPCEWLEEHVKEYDMTLKEFMTEYTTDESIELYSTAILEGVL